VQILSKRKVISALLVVTLLSFFVLPINANVVSGEWATKINDYLLQVDRNTTAEIVVFVLQSLRGHDIRKDGSEINEIVKLGVYIFNEMPLNTTAGPVVGIGKRGKDNGVLVLVAIEEREWRIEVGYGLEGDITDIESNLIAQQYLVPKFREAKYGEGLYDTVVALSQKIPTPSQTDPSRIRGTYFYENPVSGAEIPLVFIVLIIVVIFTVVIVAGIVAWKKGIRTTKIRRGGSYGGQRGGTSSGGGGDKGGGGRSGGGGAGGKW